MVGDDIFHAAEPCVPCDLDHPPEDLPGPVALVGEVERRVSAKVRAVAAARSLDLKQRGQQLAEFTAGDKVQVPRRRHDDRAASARSARVFTSPGSHRVPVTLSSRLNYSTGSRRRLA